MKAKSKNLFTIISALIAVIFVCGALFSQGAAQPAAAEKKDELISEDSGWRIRDFRPYVKAIKELEKLNKEYSENLLKLAIDEYSTGIDILDDMENDILRMKTSNQNKKYLNERWYWQEIDRKNQELRQIARMKVEAKIKSVTYFTRSINYLDEIQNVDVRQDPRYINFQSRLYQVYVSTQYDLHNFKPCIPILERFITLTEENKKDVWAYKYLASCYGYLEMVLAKNKGTEDEIVKYRSKKNRNLLQSVELQYGVESPHFKQIQDLVERDEKKSERINDYK
jgi:hypothetical protein